MHEPATPRPRPGEPGFVERRQRPTPGWSRYLLFGGRRRQSGREQYVDRFGTLEAVILVGVLLLNMIDIGATLFFVHQDIGTEVNPFARWLMAQSDQAFIWTKSLGLGAVLLFLVIAKNFLWARVALWITIAAHSLLALSHTATLCLYLNGQAGGGGV